MRALRNLTITVEDEVARWARLRAAHENKSVSRLVGEMLRAHMQEDEGYLTAMNDYLSRPPFLRGRATLPRREELHDRPRLR